MPSTSWKLRGGEVTSTFVKELRIYLRYPAWVIGDFIQNPLWFVFFALALILFAPPSRGQEGLFSSGWQFFFWGWVFFSYFSTTIWSLGVTLRREQLSGTLEQLLLTPASRLALLAGRWLRNLLMDSLAIIFVALLFSYFGGAAIGLANPPLLLIVLLSLQAMLLGFGMLYGALVLSVKTPEAVTNLLQFVVIVICGVFYPLTLLPQPAFQAALVIPFTYAIDLLRAAGMNTPTLLGDVRAEALLLVALSLATLLAGVCVFGIVEARGRRRGTLGYH